MNEIRLLIIEEHKAVRDALRVRLQSSSNIRVVAACQDSADWKTRRKNGRLPVDVVLLGLKSSGYHPLRMTIKNIKEFTRLGIAVIVLASFADDVEREMILQAGAQRYLLKDINSFQLIAEIESLATARAG